jgi:hypothetical protein
MIAIRWTCLRLSIAEMVWRLGRTLICLSYPIGVGAPYRCGKAMFADMQTRAAASRRAEAELREDPIPTGKESA